MSTDKDYLAPHLRKDVPLCNAVIIALAAVLSSVCGSTAAILSAQLAHYRKEPVISGYWMAGLLFVTPGLTGMIVAYKRRVMTLSSHLGVTIVAAVLGTLGSVYSILTIYTDECTPYPLVGECHKKPLMLLCVSNLVVASVLCLVSLGTTIFTYKTVLDKQAVVAAQKAIDDKVAAAVAKKKKLFGRKAKPQENIAMDVNSPDTLQNTNPELSSYL